MWWKRRVTRWPVDPNDVAFGSVVQDRDRNLSRTHVLVHFVGSEPRYVPVSTFVRTVDERLAAGQSLGIRRLVVAPLTKRRHARFFDRLTDWGPATQRALCPNGARARLRPLRRTVPTAPRASSDMSG